MPFPLTQVDAFTTTPFAGNPAAVCVLDAPAEAGWMQAVAREMNLSETAFVVPQDDGYGLRWFTPAAEVNLCGHATLATAHVLWEAGHLAPEQEARFHTRSGLLRAQRDGDLITLDLPARVAHEVAAPSELLAALGVTPLWVGWYAGDDDYLVEVESEGVVRGLRPNHAALGQITMQGVIVTSRATSPEYDFVSRYFAPGVGIEEDPVTGATHCTLGPYWAEQLGKTELVAYQASTRGGVVRVRVGDDGRVQLGGQAVTVLRGELL